MTFALVLVLAFGTGWAAVVGWLRWRGRRRSGADFDPRYGRYLHALADADRAPP